MYEDYFKLPIHYNNDKVQLNKNIVDDLELIKTVDSSSNSIYSYYFNNDNELSNKMVEQISKYYTTDKQFLKDNQTLLKTYTNLDNIKYSSDYKNILDIWNEIKMNNEFKEKYYYIDWSIFEFLNKSDIFLQCLSIINMTSPIISLITPIIILIVPFFYIKLYGLNLTINQYITILKCLPQTSSVINCFTKINEGNLQEKIYVFVSVGFYLFSIYQNIALSIKTYTNILNIHKYFKEIKNYLNYTIHSMEQYLKFSNNLSTFREFNNVLHDKIKILTDIRNKLSVVSELKLNNYNKIFEIGYILKCFYELHENKIYNEAIMYSFGFNGYLDCIEGLIYNIKNKQINYCDFINNSKKVVFKNSYYACLKDLKHVKNNIKLNKNLIVSGPNASGKTTVLKTTLINIIFSQQFGCGFYDSAKLHPFNYIHCYLNIPDTSGRDSLFQAEARRCKEILDIINLNKKDTHFCVFDEIYSGTNPDEAVISATSFLKYLTKNKNVSCILTTHFLKVCKNLNSNSDFLNCHMLTNINGNDLKYMYKIKNGISKIKGGVNVLRNLNYPTEIIQNAV
jgi:hypothetical protein